MKIILLLEEAATLVLSIYLFTYLPYSGWLFGAFFLSPDAGMIGYLVNSKVGAVTYNLTHHKGIAIGLMLGGVQMISPLIIFMGLIMLGHSSFDRILGYGFKYEDSFQHTHLGWIGKNPINKN